MNEPMIERLAEAQTPPVLHADHAPHVAASLYLYDQAEPSIRLHEGDRPHVAVEVRSGNADMSVVAHTPDTLRRYAAVCLAAADQLEAAWEDATASDSSAA